MQKIKEIIVYHKFNLPQGKGIECKPEECLTQQSFKDECDINNIIEVFTKTGLWGNSLKPATNQPMFGDFSNVPDFVESQNIIAKAVEQFEALPAILRKRFNNEPAEMLAFMELEENREEAIKLGMCAPPEIIPKTEPPKTPEGVSGQ